MTMVCLACRNTPPPAHGKPVPGADSPSLRPIVKLEPSDVRKISGIACHQDPSLFEDNCRDAEIICPDAAMLSP